MKILKLLYVFIAFSAVCAWAQSPPFPPSKLSRTAGRYVAYNYGQWQVSVYAISPATGAQTFTVGAPTVTLPDGRQIMPFNTNAPIKVGSETVTPSAVTGCVFGSTVPGQCQLTATFSQSHSTADAVVSGTYGLQEALNDASLSGGAVTVDGAWVGLGGTTAIVNAATVPSGTGIEDIRTGAAGGGTAPPPSAQLLGSTAGSAFQAITVGSGLNLIGTTLTGTGSGGPANSPLLGANGSGALVTVNPNASNPPVIPSTGSFTAPIPATTISAAGWTGYNAYGSSISFGVGATACPGNNTGTCWVDLLGSYIGHFRTQFAVSGSEWADIFNQVLSGETRGASSTVLESFDGDGIMNDYNHNTPLPGNYELAIDLNMRAALVWAQTPTTNKIAAPTPATNWSSDNSVYGTANNPVLVSTTNGAAQVYSYTIPSGVVTSVTPVLVYRLIDQVSGTINGGAFKAVDSYDGKTYWGYNFTNPPQATAQQGAATLGGAPLFLNNTAHATAGTYTVTVTPVSPTASTNVVAIVGIALLQPGANNTTIIGSRVRAQSDTKGDIYNYAENESQQNIAYVISQGGDGLRYTNFANCIFSQPSEMASGATGLLHPNDTGYAEMFNCVKSATAQVAALASTRTSQVNSFRKPVMSSTYTTDFLSCYDEIVQYDFSSTQAGIIIPPNCPVRAQAAAGGVTNHGPSSLRRIILTNNSNTYAMTVQGVGTYGSIASGNLSNYQISSGQTINICSESNDVPNQTWFMCDGNSDPLQMPLVTACTTATCSPTCATDLMYLTGGSASPAVTMPINCGLGKVMRFFYFTGATGAASFNSATGGNINTFNLQPGQIADVISMTTVGNWWTYNRNSPQPPVVLTSAYNNSTATASTIFSLQVGASQSYAIHCHGLYKAASTGAFTFTATGPVSPSQVNYDFNVTTALATNSPTYLDYPATGTAYPTGINTTAVTTAATDMPFDLTIGFQNGTTAGTVAIQGATIGTATLTVERGSYCTIL